MDLHVSSARGVILKNAEKVKIITVIVLCYIKVIVLKDENYLIIALEHGNLRINFVMTQDRVGLYDTLSDPRTLSDPGALSDPETVQNCSLSDPGQYGPISAKYCGLGTWTE